MHGLGNDFVVIDSIRQTIYPTSSQITHWADRHTGIGFDQLLILLPSKSADLTCKIFNADGTEAEQCGNGMRAVARYAHESGLISKKTLRIETLAGIVHATIHDPPNYKKIAVSLGIPTHHQNTIDAIAISAYEKIHTLSLGNPHAIIKVTNLQDFPVLPTAEKISALNIFPQGVNCGFMEIIDAHHIHLRTVERGVGETLACGSNASAAVITGIRHHGLISPVNVQLLYGSLEIHWAGENQEVILIGPASTVFSGSILLSKEIM